MAPKTTVTALNTAPANPEETYKTQRATCCGLKRLILAGVNLVTLIITAVYVSHAYTHSQVIDSNAALLKQPNGNFDLSMERIGWIFGIGRVVFNFICLIPILAVPEWCVFLFAVLNLVFEVPMAMVANSNFGYLVTFAQLDMVPRNIDCHAASYYVSNGLNATAAAVNGASNSLSPQQYDFFNDYGFVVGKSSYNTCVEFLHEGSLMRSSLMLAWFSVWLSFFLIAFVLALYKPGPRKWTDFLVLFTGFELDKMTWAGFRKSCTPKIGFSKPGLKRSHSGSESSTLAGTETLEVGEKGIV